MMTHYVERGTRRHSRQHSFGTDAFDRSMDSRERRPSRHGASYILALGSNFGERSEIKRRSFTDVSAPSRS